MGEKIASDFVGAAEGEVHVFVEEIVTGKPGFAALGEGGGEVDQLDVGQWLGGEIADDLVEGRVGAETERVEVEGALELPAGVGGTLETEKETTQAEVQFGVMVIDCESGAVVGFGGREIVGAFGGLCGFEVLFPAEKRFGGKVASMKREERRKVALVGDDGAEKCASSGVGGGRGDVAEIGAEVFADGAEACIVESDLLSEKHLHAAPFGERLVVGNAAGERGGELAAARGFQSGGEADGGG